MDLLRVSEILNVYYDHGSIRNDVLEAASKRGTFVHLWARNYSKGLWTPITLDDYRGYIESFKNWHNKYVQKVLFVEQKFDDPELGFTGQPDIGCILRGETDPVLIDFKTSAMTQKVWQSQLSAYLHLVQRAGYPIKRAGSLKLNADGKPARFIPCDVPNEAFAAFLSGLNALRYFRK